MKSAIMESNPIETGKLRSLDHISLNLEQVNWAAEVSQILASRPRQSWQIYLNALAIMATREWLQKYAPELPLTDQFPSVNLQQVSMQSISQLQVGDFKLVVLVGDNSRDSEINVPKALVDTGEASPDFYVFVEILEDLPDLDDPEEQAQASMVGYLTQTQFHQHAVASPRNELIKIPAWSLEVNLNRLLLCLRCLEPTGISIQHSALSAQHSTLNTQHSIHQSVMNVGTWFQDKLDRIAQEFAWTLLPPLSYSSSFREQLDPIEVFEDAMVDLRNQVDLIVPPETRTSYREFIWGDLGLRLYVSIWPVETDPDIPEWTMLLLLAAQPDSADLPLGTQLQVRDEYQVLQAPVLMDVKQDYLYAQVIGAYDEPFHVSIGFADGSVISLPPLTFAS